jgi:protein-tyrosine phosphatase
MVDIHCHILPGMDDGARTLEESISMVRMAFASGTTDIVATPHANPQYPFDPEVIERKVSELRSAIGAAVQIHVGCDFHLSATNIEDALANPTKYTINHRSYILVEFADFLIPPTSTEIFRRMRVGGMTPIITHPERNRLLQADLEHIRTWVEDECLVQVTAQSLLGRFGKSAKDAADDLMRSGLVHFVASDAHGPKDRTPVLAEAYRYVASTYGTGQADRLFVTNPKAALMGEPLEWFESVPRKRRRWYQFFGRRDPNPVDSPQVAE